MSYIHHKVSNLLCNVDKALRIYSAAEELIVDRHAPFKIYFLLHFTIGMMRFTFHMMKTDEIINTSVCL